MSSFNSCWLLWVQATNVSYVMTRTPAETNSHLITQEVQVVDGKLKTSKEGLMTSSTDDDSTTTNSSDEDNFKLKKVEKQDNEADEK